MKGNQHKKLVWQDNFIKHWTCSAKNHPEGWHWWKKRNRKKVRRMLKEELRQEDRFCYNESYCEARDCGECECYYDEEEEE